jgi:small GTP-binding protein
MNYIKIAIVGSSGSGKTSLFNLLSYKNEKPKPIVGPRFFTRQFQRRNKVKSIKIIDTSGNKKFKNMTRSFLRE